MSTDTSFDRKCVNALRFLSIDAIERAKSGHPGVAMGAATMAYVLWTQYLKYNPIDPTWFNRDRFVLSAGHGSSLLYALLHLTGYDLSMSELESFRQWGSKTPGHPESTVTPGVEVTTGPLGQGIANAVGLAMAEAHLAARYNRPGAEIIDHFTYVIAGDGDLMEGVSYEACSIAGHLNLGKLIVLYDSNRISLAGSMSLSCSEDVGARFKAQNWHVQAVEDGDDVEALRAAIDAARMNGEQPSLIEVKTIIGDGAPHKQGSFKTHGSPLGEEEVAAAKEQAGWPVEPKFYVPQDVKDCFAEAMERGKERQKEWEFQLKKYKAEYPQEYSELVRIMSGDLPEAWDADLPVFSEGSDDIATRKASEKVLQKLAAAVPELVGGSADLNPSTYTWLSGYGDFQSPARAHDGIQGTVGGVWGYAGRNIHYGVREHAMGSISVGMARHGGVIPYTATFLTFSDYMKPPIRLAALSKTQTIFIFTHDSIMVGEDGPTHQPVEQLIALRSIPDLTVIRPADANEVSVAWKAAIEDRDHPTALIFSRQKLPVLDRGRCAPAEGLRNGGYILWESSNRLPDIILIATGSEVQLALAVGDELSGEGIGVRVVSLPSWELFDRQPEKYRESVLPADVRARIAIEAGSSLGWARYVGLDGVVVGMDGFGASAPGPVVYDKFGFNVKNIAARARELLKGF